MAESFVKMMKRDYISAMPGPDGLTAVKNLAEASENDNEWHPHSALENRSPREYLWRRTSNGLSDKRCLEIQGPIQQACTSKKKKELTNNENAELVKLTPETGTINAYSVQNPRGMLLSINL